MRYRFRGYSFDTILIHIGRLPLIAAESPDTSRKTACIILPDQLLIHEADHLGQDWREVIGVNTFPAGVAPRLDRPAKYVFTEHAERNAIYKAARTGIALDKSTMILSWYPCADCARAIVVSGIGQLWAKEPDWSEERYGFRDSETILKEGGVNVQFYE